MAKIIDFQPVARRRRILDFALVPAVAFVAAMSIGGVILGTDWTGPAGVARQAAANVAQAAAMAVAPTRFGECRGGGEATCVVDGDTFRLEGEIIRIADIDTPEVHDFGCAAEKARGDEATQRLVALLNAGPFALHRADRDTDRYGRSLRIVVRDDQSVGGMLVAEGLARIWDGRKHSWC